MATAAAVPSGGQQNGPGFFDALPEVGDMINNLWTGFGQASGNDAATTNAGRSKSKSKSRDVRSQSRRRHKSKSRSKARSARSRSRGAASTRSRGRSKSKKSDRPPRHPSSVRSGKNLPGPDNFAPTAFDLSAVVALDQRREQKKRKEKQQAGSRRSPRSTGVRSKKSARSNRNKSARAGDGGSQRSRRSKAKKTHRSHSTVDTHRTCKSSGTARSNRSTRSNKSSTTAKSSSQSIKSARSSRSARTSTGDHANSTHYRAQKQRGLVNQRKGISKDSYHSGKTGKTVPTRLGSTVSNGSTKVPSHSSIASDRRTQMTSATAALAECRDDAAQDDEEFLLRKVRDDSSDDDSSSSDDDSDSSSSDDDNVGASDNDNNADGTADEESDTETNISRVIRSIGIPIGNNFDEGSNDVRSKRSIKRRGSKAKSTKSNRSRRQTTTEAAESAGFTAPTTAISSKGKASGSCDSSSDIDESEFYQGTGGDILGNKYRVVDELGKGTFGRVMKAYEIKNDSIKEKLGLGNFRGVVRPKRSGIVAIKVTRNVAKYKRDAEIEANLLRKVNRSGSRGTTFFPQLIDEFESPMGHHCGKYSFVFLLILLSPKDFHLPLCNEWFSDLSCTAPFCLFSAFDNFSRPRKARHVSLRGSQIQQSPTFLVRVGSCHWNSTF